MGNTGSKSDEATAIERVAAAAREVQSASVALEERYNASNDARAPTLSLARLTAAITELQAARNALDGLLARKSMHRCANSLPPLMREQISNSGSHRFTRHALVFEKQHFAVALERISLGAIDGATRRAIRRERSISPIALNAIFESYAPEIRLLRRIGTRPVLVDD